MLPVSVSMLSRCCELTRTYCAYVMQDILTDLTVSLKKFTIHEEPYCDMKTYIHVGMHSTAVTIKNCLLDREILSEAFDRHPVSDIIHIFSAMC